MLLHAVEDVHRNALCPTRECGPRVPLHGPRKESSVSKKLGPRLKDALMKAQRRMGINRMSIGCLPGITERKEEPAVTQIAKLNAARLDCTYRKYLQI